MINDPRELVKLATEMQPGNKLLKSASDVVLSRTTPNHIPIDYKGPFDYDNCNFSDPVKTGLIGAGLGAGAGALYGLWDYYDEKRKATRTGGELPIKKDLVIKRALQGAGLGGAAGVLAPMAARKLGISSPKGRATFESLQNTIIKSNDKGMMYKLLDQNKNALNTAQYNKLEELIESKKSFGSSRNNIVRSSIGQSLGRVISGGGSSKPNSGGGSNSGGGNGRTYYNTTNITNYYNSKNKDRFNPDKGNKKLIRNNKWQEKDDQKDDQTESNVTTKLEQVLNKARILSALNKQDEYASNNDFYTNGASTALGGTPVESSIYSTLTPIGY